MGCSSSMSLGTPEKHSLVFRDSITGKEMKIPNNNNNNNNNKSEHVIQKAFMDKNKCVLSDKHLQTRSNNKNKVAPQKTDFCKNGFHEEPLKKASLLIVSPEHNVVDMETDTSNIVPYIPDYTATSPSLNKTHRDFMSSNEQKEEIRQQIKSALKKRRSSDRNRMIADRPMKNVTFVDSVTVVTVF